MNGANSLPTPEQVGILNGRQAALQAATADLLQRGVLRSSAGGALVVGPVDQLPLTALQRAVLDGVSQGAGPLENLPPVVRTLEALQRDAVRHGLLRARRAGADEWALRVCFAAICATIIFAVAATGTHTVAAFIGATAAVGVAIIAGFLAMRLPSGGLRTPAAHQLLDQLRGQVPRDTPGVAGAGLGHAVALYGTRPLLIAFPAAATLGWALVDNPLDEARRHPPSAATSDGGYPGSSCSSGTSDSDWSGHHGGGSGDAWCSSGGCNSGSCGGSSCSSGSCGSSCGSSCGGGSSCSS